VQAEGQPLGGGEGVEHDHQRAPDRVGVLGLRGRVGHQVVGYAGRLRAETLAPGGSRAQLSRQIRETTVVSQAGRLSTSETSLRSSRSQVSWTASSASCTDPSSR
jgi:hypothetical protein